MHPLRPKGGIPMPEVKDPNFNHETPDANGDKPDRSLLQTKWLHSGNGFIYTISNFTWIGDTDEWGFVLTRRNSPVVCTRSVRNFHSWRKGMPRFLRVKEADTPTPR